jgi:hypothetical protein
MFSRNDQLFENAIVVTEEVEEDHDLVETWNDFFKELNKKSMNHSPKFIRNFEALLLKNRPLKIFT